MIIIIHKEIYKVIYPIFIRIPLYPTMMLPSNAYLGFPTSVPKISITCLNKGKAVPKF